MTCAQLYVLAPMVLGDARDADLMALYARLQLSPKGRRMLLSGLAGFDRSYPLED
jgi:hypothetical protein